MKTRKIYLIDGSAFLYRAFHAIRQLNTSKGHPTNATFGFTRILLKLLKEHSPEYAAIFFDVKGPTFRHRMYEAYKANRPPIPEELILQIPDIKEVVRALNIPMVEKTGFEADDLVGTYSKIARDRGFEVIMVTGDKDFIQLVTDTCILWDPMKDTIIDTASITEDMGIVPAQFADVLGLAGDSSDNIPGLPGVGPKTAIKLIAEFGSIENLYDRLDEIKKKKNLYENLLRYKDQVLLSRDLAKINTNVEVSQSIEDFKLIPFDREKAFDLFRKFEFKTLAREFSEKADPSQKEYMPVYETDALENLAKTLEAQHYFAIDTETTSKDPMRADLVGISFSFEPHTGFYVPVGHTDPGDIVQPSRQIILNIFKPLLENPDILKVGQNIKYDYIVLARYGITLRGIFFDTMIASYLLNPTVRGHSLDTIAMTLFGYKTISYEEVTGKGKEAVGFQDVPMPEAVRYASEDADLTFMAFKQFEKDIRDRGLHELMTRIEMPLVPVLARMEMAGIQVNQDHLKALSQSFENELNDLENQIYDLAGETFNINSSQQLGVILFEKLQLKTAKKTKKKTAYSTDVEVLTTLALEHELPERILRHRTLSKLKSTYADALDQLVHPETGRIHTSFNQTITVTGRLSSSSPNLQNIPIRKPEGKKIREAFIPSKGCDLVSADYSQIELRILAHCAEDDILIQAFKNGEDIHTRTALEVFQVMPEFVTDELRSQAKAINFGIIYGMSSFRLARDLNISRKMAQTYIDNYFKRYAGIKRFIDNTIEETRRTGEVSTIFGRTRRLDDINSSNAVVRNFAQRAAINTPIQGSAADLIKLAMIRMEAALTEKNMKTRMLLSVHDEIIFESPESERDSIKNLARTVMESVYTLKVPLVVNIGIGQNWADAH
jgi:DNA polymerase I